LLPWQVFPVGFSSKGSINSSGNMAGIALVESSQKVFMIMRRTQILSFTGTYFLAANVHWYIYLFEHGLHLKRL
jgi:hypothetical protein